MSYRITKAEWEQAGGLTCSSVYRKQSRSGRWTYWRIS